MSHSAPPGARTSRRRATRASRSGAALAFYLTLVAPGAALAAECTLLERPPGEKAELVVYFTRFEKEDASGGAYKKCRLVRKAQEGTQTFVVTQFRQDATVVVHRSNWPK